MLESRSSRPRVGACSPAGPSSVTFTRAVSKMLSISAVASRAARSVSSVSAFSLHSRRLATQVPVKAGGSSSQATKEDGPLRPHLEIPVNPNHGLFAFFRKKEKDGKTFYDTVESADMTADKSGALRGLLLSNAFADGPRVTAYSRSFMDSCGAQAKEFQGPAHAVVPRTSRAEFACDTAGGGSENRRERADSWFVGEGVPGTCLCF